MHHFARMQVSNSCGFMSFISPENLNSCQILVHSFIKAMNCDEDEDGLDEFLGISNTEAQNNQKWTESDKSALQYCIGLIKCSKSLLKKTRSAVSANGNCDSEEKISQLDDLADRVERLSPVVDELASCVYPPLNTDVVHKQVYIFKFFHL